MQRTMIGETPKLVGQEVLLRGWVNSRRDHGKIIFIDLRDRTGIVQIVCGDEGSQLRPEDVVEVWGEVCERQAKANPHLATGHIEIRAKKVTVLSKADTLPFGVYDDGLSIEEALRLKYRYLDLRRPRLARNLRLRHQVIKAMRNFLDAQDFVEIETPILTKATPEGARDFLVPSRLQPGKFYALPQSPQQ